MPPLPPAGDRGLAVRRAAKSGHNINEIAFSFSNRQVFALDLFVGQKIRHLPLVFQ